MARPAARSADRVRRDRSRTPSPTGPWEWLPGSRTAGTPASRASSATTVATVGHRCVCWWVSTCVTGTPDAEDALQLRVELAAHVVGIEAAGQAAAHDRAVAQRERAPGVDERRDLPRGQQRRVLPDEREVGAQLEGGHVAQHRRGVVERPADRQQRRRGDDPVLVGPPHRRVDAPGQPEVVGGDDRAGGVTTGPSDPATGTTCLSSLRSRTISPTIVRMTPNEDSVETPRVRGK